MALAERRTAAAGGAQATVSTAAGVWTEITTAMVNAGWTLATDLTNSSQWPAWVPSTVLPPFTKTYAFGDRVTNSSNRYMCIVAGNAGTGTGPTTTTTQTEGTVTWEYVSASTANDAYYTSNGESGKEFLIVRVQQYSTFVNVFFYQYQSGGTGFNRINLARTSAMGANQKTQQFNYSGATTINFAVIADKDSVCAVTVDQTNAKRVIMFGNLRRPPNVNDVSFVSNNSVTAGLSKTFNFSSGNPIASGYKIGDPVMVIAQESNTTSNFLIPICSTRITALTTSSITVKEVKENTAAGAIIGQDPMPFFYLYSQATSGNPGATGSPICVHNLCDESVTNLWSSAKATAEAGYLPNSGLTPIRDSAIAELDPNNRTGYFQLISQIVTFSNTDIGQFRGFVPKFYHWHTSANNQWVIAKEVRVSPAKDWLFVRDTPPSTGAAWVFGPFTATTATVSFQTFDFVTDWGYTEVDAIASFQHSCDRGSSGVRNAGGIEPPNKDRHFRIDEYHDESQGMLQWVVLQANGGPYVNNQNYSKWFQANLFTIEPYPFDSTTATQTSSSNGFNSGFN